tara:strand:+ start:23723 stop:24148 length:426 start_codon:yes stop_codon:yes gene_type:complete
LKKERKPESFITKPTFEGGNQKLKLFLDTHLKYPQDAFDNKIDGIVRIRIDIDKSGKVVKTQIIKKLGYGCDEEAVRVGKLLVFKVNAPKNTRITYHKDLNIPFILPKPSFKINYSTESKKDVNNPTSLKPKSYTYTINTN